MEVKDICTLTFGEYGLLNEATITERKWTPIAEITESKVGSEVLVRARVHSSRVKAILAF